MRIKKAKKDTTIVDAFLTGLLSKIDDPSVIINKEVKKMMAKPNEEVMEYINKTVKKKDVTLGEMLVVKKILDLFNIPVKIEETNN